MATRYNGNQNKERLKIKNKHSPSKDYNFYNPENKTKKEKWAEFKKRYE